MDKPLQVFCCYAHEDQSFLHQLQNHLKPLEHNGLIVVQADVDVSPGEDWEQKISHFLNTAQMILLLVSSSFIASDYCYSREAKRALERHEAGHARVIPVLLRAVDLEITPFNKLRVLPANAMAVAKWVDHDEAFLDIAQGIRKVAEELITLPITAFVNKNKEPPLSHFWNVPYRRNPFFLGREHILTHLRNKFKEESAGLPHPQALSGMGGIGKTQTAVEYAYRYRNDYQTVLWINASTYESFVGDLESIAQTLGLAEMNAYSSGRTHAPVTEINDISTPNRFETGKELVPAQPLSLTRSRDDIVQSFMLAQHQKLFEAQRSPKEAQRQSLILDAVKRWLNNHTDWLLVLDNADDLHLISDFIPWAGKGHILLTTRAHATGEIAQCTKLEKMDLDEAVLFLLHRARLIEPGTQLSSVSDIDRTKAEEIVREMDALPLSLDQAGAYMEETSCGLSGFLHDYKVRQATFLKRRGGIQPGHPESVATTLLLCFNRVEKGNPAAIEILRLCAFLDPAAIPEEIIKGSPDLGLTPQSITADPGKLDEFDMSIAELHKFSLVKRPPDTKTLSVHNLLQAVLKDTMDEKTERLWAVRAVRAVNRAFSTAQATNWQEYLPQVQICANHIKQYRFVSSEAAQLLYQAGCHLLEEHAQYAQATLFLQQALSIRKKVAEPDQVDLIGNLDDLAKLYYLQGHYAEAIPLLQQALSIRKKVAEPDQVDLIGNLDDLAKLYYLQDHYEQAEHLFTDALEIREQMLGREHLDIVNNLDKLTMLYIKQGKNAQAIASLQRSLTILEKILGFEHPDLVICLSTLAGLNYEQGQYSQAESLLRRALAINERVHGSEHPDTLKTLAKYTELLRKTNRKAEAAQLEAHTQIRRFRLPLTWNVPYRHNPFFTGRESILEYLREAFKKEKAFLTQPQAISGLGGIGKTQIAIEYAYRYCNQYQVVLWANASSHETLGSDLMTIADLLDIREKDSQDSSPVMDAIKNWLSNHTDWLLILDNADDLNMVRNVLPLAVRGHILLTTRKQTLGELAQPTVLEKMTIEEGALLLLRRARILAPYAQLDQATKEDRAKVKEIATAMDGLPLALDQAGAYIQETGCSLADYIMLYQKRGAELLKWRGSLTAYHPEPLTPTLLQAFQAIQMINPPAADLLCFFAFLDPDTIFEDMITAGAPDLGSTLESIVNNAFNLNSLISDLLNVSLIRRGTPSRILTIHPLVQTILKDKMDKDTYLLWSERTVRVVNRIYPEVGYPPWFSGHRYLPQALACVVLIEQLELTLPEAIQLLDKVGFYLQECNQYEQAEPLVKRALTIREKILGPEHLDTAQSLNNLAWLYHAQQRYEQAEPLYQRALVVREKLLGTEHPGTVQTLNNLARLYHAQQRYEQAEPLYQRVLAVREKTLGTEHPHTAQTLNSLGEIYHVREIFTQAIPLYQRALTIREKILGPEHLDTVQSLNNLAMLYHAQRQYEQAEPLYQQVLAVREKVLGPEHPDTAQALNHLGEIYFIQVRLIQAEPLYQRALAIREQALDTEHPDIAQSLNNLGLLYYARGQYASTEPLIKRAVAIYEKRWGSEHPHTAIALNNLATLYHTQGLLATAELLIQRVLTMREKLLGPEHPETARSNIDLALLYQDQGKLEQAKSSIQHASTIYERVLEPEHPEIARGHNDLALLYYTQGLYGEAEPLIKRALTVREKVLGPEHPETAQSLNNLALIYSEQGQHEEAELLMKRAITIYEKKLGSEHPLTATALNNLAVLYHNHGQYQQEGTPLQSSFTIFEQKLGSEHPDIARILNNLALFYGSQGEFEQAESFMKRAISIYLYVLGPEHPDAVNVLKNYANLRSIKYEEAATLKARAQAIRAKPYV